MSYNIKNYTEQGGEKTVIGGVLEIGGTLVIEEGAEVEGLPLPVLENQTDSEASTIATLKEDFNALLSKLKEAGMMEEDPEPGPEPGPEPETGGGDNDGSES